MRRARDNSLATVPQHVDSACAPCAADQLRPEELRCPRCRYIVFGLPEARCPECGLVFDWQTVSQLAHSGLRLPIETARGWKRIVGGVQTWLMVLSRPWSFARFDARSSVWLATAFAVACMAVGVFVWSWGQDTRDRVSWVIAVWFHIECQSLVFGLLDLRFRGFFAPFAEGRRTLTRLLGRWLRQCVEQWAFWRKMSLYTTAFVAIDCAGPPFFYSYTSANFPWVLDPDSWRFDGVGWGEIERISRGIAYYWWMAVLLIALWLRLRRKWCILIILVLMPGITIASCRVGLAATHFIYDRW